MVSQTPTEINWNYLKWSVVLGPGSSSSGLYFARLRACLSFRPCYREFIAISLYSSWGGNATRSNFLFVQSSIPLFDSSQYLRAYYFSTFQLKVGRDYHKLRPLPSFLNFQLLFLQAQGLLIYPHILTSIPDISIVPSRVVWLLMVIKLGYIFMASSSILYSSYSEDSEVHLLLFTACSRCSSVCSWFPLSHFASWRGIIRDG